MTIPSLKLILVDPVSELCTAWRETFADLPEVVIIHGRFESLPQYDCMVSAANSFGLMDGGVDLAIVSFFGLELMDRVQAHILAEFLGEQPVGTCLIVETGHPKHPFLAHTPTMRVPMPIGGTDNVYLAMWSMLLAVHRHNRSAARPIRTIACPGLGTLTGGMAYEEAAWQMAAAYRHFLSPPRQISWPHAIVRQHAVRRGSRREVAGEEVNR